LASEVGAGSRFAGAVVLGVRASAGWVRALIAGLGTHGGALLTATGFVELIAARGLSVSGEGHE
jgi:hypothetical protein